MKLVCLYIDALGNTIVFFMVKNSILSSEQTEIKTTAIFLSIYCIHAVSIHSVA